MIRLTTTNHNTIPFSSSRNDADDVLDEIRENFDSCSPRKMNSKSEICEKCCRRLGNEDFRFVPNVYDSSITFCICYIVKLKEGTKSLATHLMEED